MLFMQCERLPDREEPGAVSLAVTMGTGPVQVHTGKLQVDVYTSAAPYLCGTSKGQTESSLPGPPQRHERVYLSH